MVPVNVQDYVLTAVPKQENHDGSALVVLTEHWAWPSSFPSYVERRVVIDDLMIMLLSLCLYRFAFWVSLIEGFTVADAILEVGLEYSEDCGEEGKDRKSVV